MCAVGHITRRSCRVFLMACLRSATSSTSISLQLTRTWKCGHFQGIRSATTRRSHTPETGLKSDWRTARASHGCARNAAMIWTSSGECYTRITAMAILGIMIGRTLRRSVRSVMMMSTGVACTLTDYKLGRILFTD